MYDYSNSKIYGRADSNFLCSGTDCSYGEIATHQVTITVPATFAKDVLKA